MGAFDDLEVLEPSRFTPKQYLIGRKGCPDLDDVADSNLTHVWNFVWPGEHMLDYPRLLGDLQFTKFPCHSERIYSIMEIIFGVIRMQLSDPDRPKSCPVHVYFWPIPRRDDPMRVGAVWFRVAFTYTAAAMSMQPAAQAAAARALQAELAEVRQEVGAMAIAGGDGDDDDGGSQALEVPHHVALAEELHVQHAQILENPQAYREARADDNESIATTSTESTAVSQDVPWRMPGVRRAQRRRRDENGDDIPELEAASFAVAEVVPQLVLPIRDRDGEVAQVAQRPPRRVRQRLDAAQAAEDAAVAPMVLPERGGGGKRKKGEKKGYETLSWDQLSEYFSALASKRKTGRHYEKANVHSFCDDIYAHYYQRQRIPVSEISQNGRLADRDDLFNPVNAFSLDNALALLDQLAQHRVIDARYADPELYIAHRNGVAYHTWPDQGAGVYKCCERQCSNVFELPTYQLPWVPRFEPKNKELIESHVRNYGDYDANSMETQALHTKISTIKGREMDIFVARMRELFAKITPELVATKPNIRRELQHEGIGMFHQFIWNTNGLIPPSLRYIVLYEQNHLSRGLIHEPDAPRFVLAHPARGGATTVLGDYLQSNISIFDDVNNVRVLHTIVLLGYFAMLHNLLYSLGSVHIALVGDAAAGKTTVMDIIKRMIIAGTYMAMSTITPSAFYDQKTVISDQYDVQGEFYNEIDPEMFGQSTNGKSGNNENTKMLSQLKERTDCGRISKLKACEDPLSGEWGPMQQIALVNNVIICATNAPQSTLHSAMKDRLCTVDIPRAIRANWYDRSSGGEIDDGMKLLLERCVFRSRCVQALFGHAATMMRTGLIVHPSTDAAITLINEIMNEADQCNLRETQNSRHRNRWQSIAEALCITDAILRVFRNKRERKRIQKLLKYRRTHGGNLPDGFHTDPEYTQDIDPWTEPVFELDPTDFVKLEKWLYVRQEHIICAAAMMSNQWERQVDIQMMRTIQNLYAPLEDMLEVAARNGEEQSASRKKHKHSNRNAFKTKAVFEQEQLALHANPRLTTRFMIDPLTNVAARVALDLTLRGDKDFELIQKLSDSNSIPRVMSNWLIPYMTDRPMSQDVRDAIFSFIRSGVWDVYIDPDHILLFMDRARFEADFQVSAFKQCIERRLSHRHARDQTLIYARTRSDKPDELQTITIKRVPEIADDGSYNPEWKIRNYNYLSRDRIDRLKQITGASDAHMERVYTTEEYTIVRRDIDEWAEECHRKRLFEKTYGRHPTRDEVESWICKSDEWYNSYITGRDLDRRPREHVEMSVDAMNVDEEEASAEWGFA